MRTEAIIVLVAAFASGCASLPSSLPDGYIGEVSKIRDTENRIDIGKADLFYLAKLDGKPIRNSRTETRIASQDQGNILNTILLNNTVTVADHSLTIVGRTEYAMPIRALTGDVFEVKGEVSFTPKPNRQYVIKGNLSEQNSSVWIEDAETHEIIGQITSSGSAKLGVFEK